VAWLSFKRLCLLLAAAHMQVGLASWCVAVGPVCGSEETPPTCRIAVPSGIRREPWQRSRNETSTRRMAMMHVKLLSLPCGNGETAVLQVERANRRR
jgi:hypothetical protein